MVVSEAILKAGLRLSIHLFFLFVFRSYDLAPTQLNLNSWSQMVGFWMYWREASHGMEMHLLIFHTLNIPKVTAEGDRIEGWYYMTSWGRHSICTRPAEFHQRPKELVVLGFKAM